MTVICILEESWCLWQSMEIKISQRTRQWIIIDAIQKKRAGFSLIISMSARHIVERICHAIVLIKAHQILLWTCDIGSQTIPEYIHLFLSKNLQSFIIANRLWSRGRRSQSLESNFLVMVCAVNSILLGNSTLVAQWQIKFISANIYKG